MTQVAVPESSLAETRCQIGVECVVERLLCYRSRESGGIIGDLSTEIAKSVRPRRDTAIQCAGPWPDWSGSPNVLERDGGVWEMPD